MEDFQEPNPQNVVKGGEPVIRIPPEPPIIDDMHTSDKEGLRLRLQHAQLTYRQFAKDERFLFSRALRSRCLPHWIPIRKSIMLVSAFLCLMLCLIVLLTFGDSERMLRHIEEEEPQQLLTPVITICPILTSKQNDFMRVRDLAYQLFGYVDKSKVSNDFTPTEVIQECSSCHGVSRGNWEQVKSLIHGFCLKSKVLVPSKEMTLLLLTNKEIYDGFIVYVHQRQTSPYMNPIASEKNYFRARRGYSTAAVIRTVIKSRSNKQTKCDDTKREMEECLQETYHNLGSEGANCYLPTKIFPTDKTECTFFGSKMTEAKVVVEKVLRETLPKEEKCNRDCPDTYYEVVGTDSTRYLPTESKSLDGQNISDLAEIKIYPYSFQKKITLMPAWSLYSLIAWIAILVAFFLNLSVLHCCGLIHTTCYLIFYRKRERYSRIQYQLTRGLERMAQRRLWLRKEMQKPVIRQADIGRVRNLAMLYQKYYGMSFAEQTVYTNLMNLRVLCHRAARRRRKPLFSRKLRQNNHNWYPTYTKLKKRISFRSKPRT